LLALEDAGVTCGADDDEEDEEDGRDEGCAAVAEK